VGSLSQGCPEAHFWIFSAAKETSKTCSGGKVKEVGGGKEISSWIERPEERRNERPAGASNSLKKEE